MSLVSFFSFLFLGKVVKLGDGVSVINRAYPVYFIRKDNSGEDFGSTVTGGYVVKPPLSLGLYNSKTQGYFLILSTYPFPLS